MTKSHILCNPSDFNSFSLGNNYSSLIKILYQIGLFDTNYSKQNISQC